MSFSKSEHQKSDPQTHQVDPTSGVPQPSEGDTVPAYHLPDAPPATEVQLEDLRARDSEEVEAQEEQCKAQEEQRKKNQEEAQKRLEEQRKKRESQTS